ncbi:hypothetical protein [Zavarzinia sp.]|uniref:hypothetical protein n=1 Tax=Zavarzinia sp. TaxID=2027920 RepID=UPI0035657EC0
MADSLGAPVAKRGEFERQATVVVGALLTAGVVWMAQGVSETAANVAALKVQIEGLREQVAELKESGRTSFPAEDARREFGRVDARLADLETRLRRIEHGGTERRP